MPDLACFAAFAERVGKLTSARENCVPLVPHVGVRRGTPRGTEEHTQKQSLSDRVPHVPLVPHENSQAENEEDLQAAFEERAAILEYDGGWTRPEAERLARIEVFGAE